MNLETSLLLEEFFEDFDMIDLDISAQMVLNHFEYDLFTKYRAGFTFLEIAKKMETEYYMVRKCFTLICQKLRSQGMSQT